MAGKLTSAMRENLNKLKRTIPMLKQGKASETVNLGDLVCSIAPLIPSVTTGAEAADKIKVTVQLKDTAGRVLTSPVHLHAKVLNASPDASLDFSADAAWAGSILVKDAAEGRCVLTTDSTGKVEFEVTDAAAAGELLLVEFSGIERQVEGTIVTLTFAA